jgi:hypothetical protein
MIKTTIGTSKTQQRAAIDETFCKAILFASSPDGETSQDSNAEKLIRIIQTKIGPNATALIQLDWIYAFNQEWHYISSKVN